MLNPKIVAYGADGLAFSTEGSAPSPVEHARLPWAHVSDVSVHGIAKRAFVLHMLLLAARFVASPGTDESDVQAGSKAPTVPST
jgi:hypothetical protein